MTAERKRTRLMSHARYGRRCFSRTCSSFGFNEFGARYTAVAMVVVDVEEERENRNVRSARGEGVRVYEFQGRDHDEGVDGEGGE